MARTQPLNPQTLTDAKTATRPFTSILFPDADVDVSDVREPACFPDLNLDQVVAAVTIGAEEYALAPFFYAPLRSVGAVEYRHDVCRALGDDVVRQPIEAFAVKMKRVRRYLVLVEKQRYPYEKERWFLDAACTYCSAVSSLTQALAGVEPRSEGLQGVRDYLVGYTASEAFRSLEAAAVHVRDGLARIRYSVRIKGLRVTVGRYEEAEPDYSVEVERDFERFRQRAAGDHRFDLRDPGSMDHVEAQIVERVARLFPDAFAALDDFFSSQRDFVDSTIARFDREVQFYLAYLAFSERLTTAELSFTYPVVSEQSKEVSAEGAFDLALADKFALEGSAVVRNDFSLRGPERLLVVTGPNQGGKTTFARMFGQLHYVACLGLPVPAVSAQLFLPDRIFTHFEKEEDIATLRGKLDDELVRVRDMLEVATGDSVILLNEVFSSTTLHDALAIAADVLRRIIELGSLGVCVTFIDELTELGEATVSMMATVAPEDPAKRTFKIVRRPADGRAYSLAIAEKYGLTHESLTRRVQ
jgi:DNA mismatch repair protein MutS